MTSGLSRRALLATSGGLALTSALPWRLAAAGQLTAAIYPGTWDEAYRLIVAPAVKEEHGIDVAFDPLFAVDQIAKARAGRGLPPFDVFVLDPGPRASGIDMGLFAPFDSSRLARTDKLPDGLVDEHGVAVAAQVVGIGYNPSRVPAPTGWQDLFKPEYASRLGLTGFQTTFGTVSLIEIAKLHGGSETNVQPAIDEIKKILPEVAAVAAPAAMPGLFQQGQIDVMYTNTQTVTTLRARGVDIEFAVPETGAVAFFTTMHVAAGAENEDGAYKYLDTVISAPVQEKLAADPYYLVPVNVDVPLGEELPLQHLSEITSFVSHDWSVINPQRAEWIEQFNREVAK
jgi:putative spermidine/putrescine transport system substrate-binding protein